MSPTRWTDAFQTWPSRTLLLYVTSTVQVAGCWPGLTTSTPAMNPLLLSPVTMYRAVSRTGTVAGGVGERVGRGDVFGARLVGETDGDGDNDGRADGDGEGEADTVITISGSAATDVACFSAAGRPMPSAPITTAHSTAPATARTRTDQNDGVVPARCFATGAETTANDQAAPSRRPPLCGADP